MALIAGYTLTPAHIGGPWSLTGPYTDAQNTQVLLRGGLGKREAEPEADAYYGLGLGGYGWAGLGGLVAPLAIHRDGPFLCGNGEHLINGLCKKKRSAEAEPEAYYGAIGYGYGAAVPPTGLPVQPLVPAGPWGALVPRKTPAVEAAEADHFAAIGKREADSDAYYGYGGYGGYGAYTTGYGLGYGYGGYGKRSADSEADAYYGYGGYGGYGLGYTTGYGLGYGYGGYGKRSADSEADAYYGYGGYGGYGLGYGGYGYGGLGYGYGKRSADASYGYGGAYTGYGYGGYGLGLGYGYGYGK